MSDKERELVEYFIKIVEETPSLHEKWINPPIKIITWKHLLELDKRLEDIKIINEEHRVLNGKLREELEFEKATNKELLSTGAELENKLYEEQDKNKRLQKENQILMNSMVTEAHTKETKEIERLNNIIGEAIEYIEERYNGEVLTHTFDKDNVGELLNILKEVIKSDRRYN